METCVGAEALDGREGSGPGCGRFTPNGTRWTGDWMALRAGLDAVEKRKIFCLCRETNPDSSIAKRVAVYCND
jgi:hypothetical protein